MKVLQGLAALALGFATAAAAVVLHDIVWTLVLAWVATVLTVWALPAGLRGRVPYAIGWMLTLWVAVTPTSTGGYLLGSTSSGYATLALGLVAFSAAIATLPLRRRRRLARNDQASQDSHDLPG